MPADIRRSFKYQFGAALAGFVATLSLVAVLGWATVGTNPTAIFAHAEYSKA
ncbi:MAG: hypothetical protein AB7G10_16570 [Reyranellaceae bacterium]